MGVVVSGAAIGGIIFPMILNRLLNHHHLRFGWSVRIIGFIMFALLIYTVLITKEFAPHRQENMFLSSAWPSNLTNAGFLPALPCLCGPIFYIADYAMERGDMS